MKSKIIMFLILGISGAAVCFAQSDFSSEGYQKEDGYSVGNEFDSVGINSDGNLFPDSSSEKAEGVYTDDSNGITTH